MRTSLASATDRGHGRRPSRGVGTRSVAGLIALAVLAGCVETKSTTVRLQSFRVSFSTAVDQQTGSADAPLPYSLQTPIPERPAVARAALAAIPPTDYDPFDAETVLRTSYVDDCLEWPVGTVRPPFTGPLPDVPALLLAGRLDTRTPLENAQATQRELPHAALHLRHAEQCRPA